LSRNFKILIFLFFAFHLQSQIEITSNPFYFLSDTKIRYTVDYVDKDFNEIKGTYQTWNLKDNESPLYKDVGVNISTGNQGQNIKVKDGDIVRTYKKIKSEFNEFSTAFSPTQVFNYNSAISLSYKNIKYGAKFSEKASFSAIFNREDIPYKLQKYMSEKIKRIRLAGVISKSFHCDAYGRFIIQNKNIAALRLKIIEKIDFRLYDDKTGKVIPIYDNNLLSLIYPEIGINTYYLFFSNSSKLWLAKIKPNSNAEGYVIEYQDDDNNENEINISNRNRDVFIYPNPTYGDCKLLFNNFAEANFIIEIYNVIGKKIWSKQQYIDPESIYYFDFSFLRKGTYLISIKDKSDNLLLTKKLVIIGV
jgi:hypothetical protein